MRMSGPGIALSRNPQIPSWQYTAGAGLHSGGFSSQLPFLKLSFIACILARFCVFTGLAQPGQSLGLHSASVVHMLAVLMSSKAPSRSFLHSSGLIFEH